MVNELIKKIGFWSQWVGWALFLTGIVSTLMGMNVFFVGFIPCAITTYMGWKLIQSAKQAKKLSQQEVTETELAIFLKNYLAFFKTKMLIFALSFMIYVVGVYSKGMDFLNYLFL